MSFFNVYTDCDPLHTMYTMQMYPKQDESIAWEAGNNYTCDYKCGVVVGKNVKNLPSEKIEDYVLYYLPKTQFTDDTIPEQAQKQVIELVQGEFSFKLVTTDERTLRQFFKDPWQVADYQDRYSFEKLTVTLLEDDE